MLHGTYSRGMGDTIGKVHPKGAAYVKGRLFGSDVYFGAGFNRAKDGNIRRPRITEGWYDYSEIQAGIRAGLVNSVQVEEWVAYSPCDCLPPIRNVATLYQRRLSVGKETLLGKSAKLVYNSMYGKFAQSIGAAPFGNWVYAALITSGCRQRILDAIASHPGGSRSVAMVATDGIFFDSRHPTLELSNRIGEWEEARRENLTLFKPGVYWDDKARELIRDGKFTGFKARGVNARYFAQCIGEADRLFYNAAGGADRIPEFRFKLWETNPHPVYLQKKWPGVEFEIGFSMTSALTALQRGKWGEAGDVAESVTVEHTSNPHSKRGHSYWDHDGNPPRIRTSVLDLEESEIASIPYEKRFGTEDPFSLENQEYLGIHPEGSIRFIQNTIARNLTGEE